MRRGTSTHRLAALAFAALLGVARGGALEEGDVLTVGHAGMVNGLSIVSPLATAGVGSALKVPAELAAPALAPFPASDGVRLPKGGSASAKVAALSFSQSYGDSGVYAASLQARACKGKS